MFFVQSLVFGWLVFQFYVCFLALGVGNFSFGMKSEDTEAFVILNVALVEDDERSKSTVGESLLSAIPWNMRHLPLFSGNFPIFPGCYSTLLVKFFPLATPTLSTHSDCRRSGGSFSCWL